MKILEAKLSSTKRKIEIATPISVITRTRFLKISKDKEHLSDNINHLKLIDFYRTIRSQAQGGEREKTQREEGGREREREQPLWVQVC